MTKVSIGLRGWRFDEDAVFDEDGDFRPLPEMDEDTRQRLLRLQGLLDLPCDACYLIHGEEQKAECNTPTTVYGEPFAEVLLCDDHEVDFYYWYQEAGGDEYTGTEAFQDEFHEWFAAGNRAPDWYDGPDHVQTDPDSLPSPDFEEPDPEQFIPEDAEEHRVDLREGIDEPDVDLDAEYPGGDE